MAFILKTDYGTAIQDNVLDAIVESDDDLIVTANKAAVELMKGYLNNRYDVVAIFSETGDARHPVVLMYGIDIALYDLHRRINPRKIPAFRSERYKIAKEWLMDISEGIINPPDLPVPDSGDKDYFRFGSNPKRVNHI